MAKDPPKTPAESLERIRQGGEYLAMVARGRIGEAIEALEHGDFAKAETHLNEALAKVHPLTHAQQYLAGFGDETRVIRAKDLHEGLTIHGLGTASTVEHTEIEGTPVVRVLFENGDRKQFAAEQELATAVAESEGEHADAG